MRFVYLLTLLPVFLLSACATQNDVSTSNRNVISDSEYASIINKNSDHVRIYNGFQNALDIQAVIINSKVAEAQLSHGTRIYQWSDEKFMNEKAKFEARLASETEFFVSFFTPERKNDDLFKPDSIWRVFLDVNGKRYEPKIERVKLSYAEIVGMYPIFSRFSTPYRIVFPVPANEVQQNNSTLTFTSPIATGTLKYSSLK